jgi:hypothetical protein
MAASFKYRSVGDNDFRVLYLEPSLSKDEPLSFSLRHVRFEDKAQYIAVSYTWDDQPFDQNAFCEGCQIRISRNCCDILKTVRHPEVKAPIWIDQICIDQTSPDDKSRNVARMGQIFKNSTAVFIWTGLWDEEMTAYIISLVSHMEETPMINVHLSRVFNSAPKSKRYIGPLYKPHPKRKLGEI